MSKICSRKFSKVFLCGYVISACRVLDIKKHAKTNRFVVYMNSRAPLFTLLMKVDALETARIVFASGGIGVVLSRCCNAQVAQSVVQCVAIDVVNLCAFGNRTNDKMVQINIHPPAIRAACPICSFEIRPSCFTPISSPRVFGNALVACIVQFYFMQNASLGDS